MNTQHHHHEDCLHDIRSKWCFVQVMTTIVQSPRSIRSISYQSCKHNTHLSLPIRELHNSPLPTPRPLARAIFCAPSRQRLDALIFTLRQAHYNICFASAEGENADAGARAHRSDGVGERGGGGPCGLTMLVDVIMRVCGGREIHICSQFSIIEVSLENDQLALFQVLVELWFGLG
jgi:hypothetical protein